MMSPIGPWPLTISNVASAMHPPVRSTAIAQIHPLVAAGGPGGLGEGLGESRVGVVGLGDGGDGAAGEDPPSVQAVRGAIRNFLTTSPHPTSNPTLTLMQRSLDCKTVFAERLHRFSACIVAPCAQKAFLATCCDRIRAREGWV